MPLSKWIKLSPFIGGNKLPEFLNGLGLFDGELQKMKDGCVFE
jgi:hypothetical protein